jgi:hypothetical protein
MPLDTDQTEAQDAAQAALIEAAAASLAAGDQVVAAHAALKEAEAGMRTAQAASASLSGDAFSLAEGEQRAEAVLKFARRAVELSEQRREAARLAHVEAGREAHRPKHDAAVQDRRQAVRRADAARAELAAADADFQRATRALMEARAAGCRASAHIDGAALTGPVTSERTEQALWGH